jgi:2,4-dienoyl-CoA reductase-like NADH-dependent reductase (Old Yellow Enzyme family)
MCDILFTPIRLGTLTARNRIVRSATYEGAADGEGRIGDAYVAMYDELAATGVGLIITGFTAISREGRAMQPLQARLDSVESVEAFRRMTRAVHRHGTPVVLQLAHAGRQTRSIMTGSQPVSCTRRRSVYFREKPRMLTDEEIRGIIVQFASSAVLAQEAGFDGIQLHAAHGYLLHQFLLRDVNRRTDRYGIDPFTGIGTTLLEEVVDAVRERCGADFPILVKISGETDFHHAFYPHAFDHLVMVLHRLQVAAIEISYGTMDHAMNIFRGDVPLPLVLRHNPLFATDAPVRRAVTRSFLRNVILPAFLPFTPMYNLEYAERAKVSTTVPVISVGGFRSRDEMEAALAAGRTDLVAMSRPFLREPDLVARMQAGERWVSACTHCNQCVVMCDAPRLTKCHQRHVTTAPARDDAPAHHTGVAS